MDRALVAVRHRLGPVAAASHWAYGRGLTPEQMVAEAGPADQT